jgi:cell division protein FtsB
MQDIKHHKESFFYTRFWIVVLVIFSILLSLSVIRIYRKYAHAKSIRDEYAGELIQIQKNRNTLQANIEALSTPRGKEAEIRDRYRVVKEGEQMILIVNNDKNETEVITDTQEVSQDSFFKKILLFFKQI